ncbi:hypothetical protein L3Q82_024752 [Scortum barcoo]|uniref:Uncharacterized protein n=1 Tax=Scortum barcoo TaxID=214431 RepID=A0ACB8WQB2_9TELE|nr:hypothetical protein L3Q82_024752 [Scortum barcoo]
MAAPFILLVLCWALRLSCSVNSPEWFQNISTSLFNLSGDVMLGGLFPINLLTSNLSERREPDNISCESVNDFGLGLALVMKYAVDEINANRTLLPGIKLGYQMYDTCSQPVLVVKPAISFLTSKANKTLPVECNYTNYETSVSAVIGPDSSEMVSVIGKLLGFFLMPQISYGATGDKFSDKYLYPSFFRTVPSDKWQVEVMVLLLNEFNWNWVVVVGSEEEYGQQGVQEFSKVAENRSVCVAYQGLIPVYTDPEPAIKTIINNIEATNVTVVVIFSLAEQTEVFFKEVIRRNMSGVWITSTSWAMHRRLTSLPNIQTVGTILAFTDRTQTLDLLTPYTQELLTKLRKENAEKSPPKEKSSSPDNPCPQCWNLSPDNISLVEDPEVKNYAFSVYAAIYSVAKALHNLLGCNSTTCMQGHETKIYPWKLVEVLRKMSIDIKGIHLEFNDNGHPNIGYNLVQWVWKDSKLYFVSVWNWTGLETGLNINKSLIKWHKNSEQIPQSTCSAAAQCGPGRLRRVKGFHSCCFDCIDCQAGTYLAHEEDIQCTPCPHGQWSVIRSTNCTNPTFVFLSWDTSEALNMMLGGVLLLVCQGSVGAMFLKHHGTALVKASGGALSFVALLSLMGACLSLLLFLGEPKNVVCRLQLPLTSIFQTVTLSIIMFISLQIFFISEFPETAASHLNVLRGPGSWLFVLVCCAVQAGIIGCLQLICIMAAPFILLVLCWALRLSCSVNSPEWFQNISTSLFNLSGDVMLGGLFPINLLTSNLSERREPDNISCESVNNFGLGLALVMKYAVDEINANQILLPGIKLGYQIYDTCRQSAIIVKPTISFLTSKANKTLPVECNYTNYETSVSAVIGPDSSEMVSVIGKLLGFFLMPQISYGATSDKFSDKYLYPSFLRTVPSDKWQVEVMVLLLNEFNWNWVVVVGSEEEYGQQGVQEFSKVAENRSVCVAYQGLIPVYTDPEPAIKTIINNIEATKVGVVVVFSLAEPAELFFKEVIRRNMSGVWIASTSWAMHYRLTSLPNIQTVGTILAFTDRTQTLDLLTPYTQELLTKLRKENAEKSPPKEKSSSLDNPCPQCWNLSPDNISLVKDPAVVRSAFSVYAAISSVAKALHNLLGCNSTTCMQGPETKIYPWKLLKILRNTSLDINGTYLEFDQNGNPNIGYDVVVWVWNNSGVYFKPVGNYQKKLDINRSLLKWHTKSSKIPESTCSSACEPGQVRRVKGFHSCCFDCIDCMPGTYQAKEEDIQCTPCPHGQWSVIRSTNCTNPTFVFLSWDTSEALNMMLGGVLLLVCQGSVGAMFLKHHGTALVKASGGALSFVALLSLMGACLSLLLFLGEPNNVVCRLQLPLTSIFQTVTLSIIMFISLQIFFISEFPETAASHLNVLRGPGSWLFVLVCCAVQAGIIGWFVQDGPSLSQYLADMKIDFMSSFLACPVLPMTGFALMQGFNSAMALISFMCTFMAAKPLHQYNLARDVTFSSLIYCVIWVVFIPIYIGLDDKNRSIVYISFTLASNFGLMAAYYFPKCYLLLRKPELNTEEHFCTFLEGVPPKEAQEEPQPQPESGK